MIGIFCEWPCFYLLNMTMLCLSIRSVVSQHHPFLLGKKCRSSSGGSILNYIYYITYIIYHIFIIDVHFSEILNFPWEKSSIFASPPCHRRASRDPSVASATGFPTTGCRAERLDSPKRLGALGEGLPRRNWFRIGSIHSGYTIDILAYWGLRYLKKSGRIEIRIHPSIGCIL